jgi:hypothetical protein
MHVQQAPQSPGHEVQFSLIVALQVPSPHTSEKREKEKGEKQFMRLKTRKYKYNII